MNLRQRRPDVTRSTASLAALSTAFVWVGLDAIVDVFGPGPTTELPWVSRVISLLLPLLPGALVGIVLLIAPWRLIFLVLALVGWRFAEGLSRTKYAAVDWRPEWWPVTAAVIGSLVALAFIRRPPRLGRQEAWLYGFCALTLMGWTATWQRGRYLEWKDAGILLTTGLVFLTLLAFRIGKRVRTLVVLSLTLITVALGSLSATRALREGPEIDFLLGRTVAGGRIASLMRALARDSVTEPSGFSASPPHFLGSSLDRRSRDWLVQGPRPRGVLVISIDAMRWDLLDRSVGSRPVAPTISRLAKEGMVFERAYCPAPISQVAFYGMYSGLYPSQFLAAYGSFDDIPLATMRWRKLGIETRSIIPHGIMTVQTNKLASQDLGFEFPLGHHWEDPTPARIFQHLRPRSDGPFLLHWHALHPHFPYDQHPQTFAAGDSEWEKYCAEVRHADDDLRQVLEKFKSAGLLDDMWLLITSDHGEEFQEHGYDRHGTQVFEESVRVPLILHGPGIEPGRFKGPVSLIDFVATFEQIFDLDHETAPQSSGRGWVAALAGLIDGLTTVREAGETAREVWSSEVVVDLPPVGTGSWNPSSALITPEKKLIFDERNRRFRLFDLMRDPAERRNLASEQRRGECEGLFQTLRRLQAVSTAVSLETTNKTLPSMTSLVANAADIGDVAVSVLANTIQEWDVDGAVSLLCHFSDFRSPDLEKVIEQRFADDARPEVRRAAAASRLCNGRGTLAEWNRLRDRWDEIENEELRGVILEIARRREDSSLYAAASQLLSQASPKAITPDAFSAAFYLSTLSHKTLDSKWIEAGLASPRHWIKRRSASVATGGQYDLDPNVLSALEQSASDRHLLALLRFLRLQHDTPDRFLLQQSLGSRFRWSREAACRFVAITGTKAPHLRRQLYRPPFAKSLPDGCIAADQWAMKLDRKNVTLSLENSGPGHLAIFIQLARHKKPHSRVALIVGDQREVISEHSHDPARPVMRRIEDGSARHNITIEVIAGRPQDVKIGAIVWYPDHRK
ncbi:MAG: sulfatase-like hydrolase/transferase [Planctomycetota bacterium]